MKALVIKVSGENYATELSTDLSTQGKEMREILQGYLEAVSIPNAILWCNEDGHAKNLPLNVIASQIAHTTILGNVIITGPADSEGDITPLEELAWKR